jgi:hypothetical protein
MKRFTVFLIIKTIKCFKKNGNYNLLVTIKVVLRSSKVVQWVQKTVRMETVPLSRQDNEVE